MAPDQSAICPEKIRLLRAYQIATADYARTILVLSEWMGVMTRAQYNEILDFSKVANARAEEARVALDRHVAEHGC